MARKFRIQCPGTVYHVKSFPACLDKGTQLMRLSRIQHALTKVRPRGETVCVGGGKAGDPRYLRPS